ncbi:restriction endonuclease subunit S [Helicobacter pylori]
MIERMDALMLPLNWQRVRLGDIANYLTSNLSAEQITQQGKIKVYDVNNFIGYTDTTFISDKPYISIVKDGSVGRVRILPPKTNILSTMGALIANHRTTTEFLFYLLSNFDFKNFTSGSIIPHIYFKDYKEKTIFLPSLNEQSTIANILSGLDHYLCSLDALILKKESVKKALSFELLSQRKRLKGFNQAWQRVRLGDIANYLTSNLSAEQITQQGKIKVYDVNNFIGYTDTTFISDKPYISIVKDGSVGRVRILPPKTNILSTMGALIANHRTTTEFLFYLLSNFDFKNFTSGSIIPHIYFKDYKEKTIFLPSLNEQSTIANILSGLDNEIASLKNKKRQFENIKKALNHDLMSAKIRVLKK